ncbi:MAG TPA: cysteine desulfurase-like protein [Gemmatimonadales bacterium]|nr:cysteine desulfurase-like protein [Gemmatimonadales bacterium]
MASSPTLERSETPVAGVEEIRRHFPALAREIGGQPVAYFDGPGGTQTPRAVVEAMADYLYHHNANTHWAYPSSVETDRMIAAARGALADFLNGGPDEVAFGANMTTLTYHLARALGRGWGPGDEVIVTELDHHANIAPWQAVERERGITLRRVPLRVEEGDLNWAALEQAISRRTRLLALGGASNALGTVTDVARAAGLARSVGALTFVDAVHYAPHFLVDVQQLGCDFLACSAYKFYGPHVGVLWGRRDLLASLEVPKLDPAPNQAPERMETGTQNHEGIAGAMAAVDFLAALAPGPGSRRERLGRVFAHLHRRGQDLFSRLWDGLGTVASVRRYGPPPSRPRTPTLSFAVTGHRPVAVAQALATRGVFASHGDFYAATVMERLGHADEGLVRAGCACYTSEGEIDRLLEGVASLG